jgi:hypothetical protein
LLAGGVPASDLVPAQIISVLAGGFPGQHVKTENKQKKTFFYRRDPIGQPPKSRIFSRKVATLHGCRGSNP